MHDGTISVIVTKCVLDEEVRHHPQKQDSHPLPKTPPDTRSTQFCVCRACAAHCIHCALLQKYQRFYVDSAQSFCQP